MQRRTLLKALAAAWRCCRVRRRRRAGGIDALARRARHAGAAKSPLAARGLLNGLARAGKRMVAVGQRGHVLLLRRRRQDLAAGRRAGQLRPGGGALPDADDRLGRGPRRRRAAQHRRRPQLDAPARRPRPRRRAGRALRRAQRRRPKWRSPKRQALRGAGRREPVARRLVRRCDATAIVVGAFGLVLRTARRRHDLGAAAARDRQPEEPAPVRGARHRRRALHRRRAGPAAEARPRQRPLRARSTLPYKGTLFGVVGNERVVVAYGLRGNVRAQHRRRRAPGRACPPACRSASPRARSTSAAASCIVSQAGHVLVSSDDGASFAPAQGRAHRCPAAAVVGAGAGMLVLAGPRGVQTVTLRLTTETRHARRHLRRRPPPPTRSSSSTREPARCLERAGVQPPPRGDAGLRASSPCCWPCWRRRKLTLSASFEKMIPRSHPYIQNYLENRDELRGLGNALRIVVENPQRRHLRPGVPRRRCARSTTSCS